MKSLLLLFLSAHQVGGVHLHQPNATTGSTNSTTRIPVAVVMFDRNYMRLFDCFLRYWTRQSVDAEHANKLDVVVYDRAAYLHARKVIDNYPAGWVRNLQLREIPLPARRRLRRARRAPQARTTWSSLAYQAYFWKAVLEHLEQGDDVLHIDLDAIVVGGAWAPLASSDPSADIVGPPADGPSIGHEYILYRSTPATKEVVNHFWSIWLEWFSGASSTAKHRRPPTPPLPAEQKALGAYMSRYNPGGCTRARRTFLCKTHAGGTFTWHAPASLGGLVQNGQCKFPEECRAEGAHISHGRRWLGVYCAPEEIRGAQAHP